MLMGIPKILTPELVKILMEMGHGDKIVIAVCKLLLKFSSFILKKVFVTDFWYFCET